MSRAQGGSGWQLGQQAFVRRRELGTLQTELTEQLNDIGEIECFGSAREQLLLHRPKQGFGVPIAQWFRESLRDFVWDHLTSAEFLNRGIVSGEFVRHLLEEHESKRRDNNTSLWLLLMLELWFRDADRGARTHACSVGTPAGATPIA